LREADLYAPVKAHLEAFGYVVRGEVLDCDVLAHDAQTGQLIAVELKLSLGLPVIYQALGRLAGVDLVYIGVAVPPGARARRNWDGQLRDAIRLCRMLGLGLLSVRNGQVTAHADPTPYTPRKSAARRGRLLSEFNRRSGDHNIGGTNRRPRVTAYREDALRCARALRAEVDGLRPAALRDRCGVARAATILRGNVYQWFEKLGPARYGLTAAGIAALEQYADILAAQDVMTAGGGPATPLP
jgi:hypothetical protein